MGIIQNHCPNRRRPVTTAGKTEALTPQITEPLMAAALAMADAEETRR